MQADPKIEIGKHYLSDQLLKKRSIDSSDFAV